MKILSKLKYQLAVILVAVLISNLANAQTNSSKLSEIHGAYYGKWYKTITFEQQTNFYRNDSLKLKQTWKEAGKFPDLFRIDFGNPEMGNGLIFRGDSAYRYRKGKVVSASIDPNILIYLLGGIYYDKLDIAKQRLTKSGFDVNKFDQRKWKDRDVYVVGANSGDSTSNQLWYDAKNLYLVRMIRKEDGRDMDVHFEGHEQIGKIWHENFVRVIANGKLVQEEIYSNFKSDVPLNDDIFDPKKLVPVKE